MPEVVLLALVIGAAIIILVVLVVSDYLRQKLRMSSGRYEERIRELQDRVTELELDNMRLLDQVKSQARLLGAERKEKT
ncbi:MAG TPA: hypothetical protein VJO15_10035 [Dehalococcoidia bacterium]|nr:hypothetical protein [Dehalococcoidia bacterium]